MKLMPLKSMITCPLSSERARSRVCAKNWALSPSLITPSTLRSVKPPSSWRFSTIMGKWVGDRVGSARPERSSLRGSVSHENFHEFYHGPARERASDHLDACGGPRCPEEARVPGDERRIEERGQCHVGGVVGRQVRSQSPDSRQQQIVGVTLDRKGPEKRQGLLCPARIELATGDEAAQHLGHLDVQQMRRMEGGGGRRQQAFREGRAGRRVQEHLDGGRGIQHDHRPSRSAATASAIVSRGSKAGRLRSRASSSSRVGRSIDLSISRSRYSDNDIPASAALALTWRWTPSGTLRIWIIFDMCLAYLHA